MALKSKSIDNVRDLPVAAVQKEEMVRVNLSVPDSQRVRWKVAAASRKMTLADLISMAVEAYLKEQTKE